VKELVSIIIPVYKTERYLERCVRSVLLQDYPKLEMILVDDGSPDNSGMLCDALASSDSRISVIHKENGGLSSARNAGIEIVKGQYICFVDSDDYIEKDYVSTLYNLMVRHDADLAKIDYAEVTSDNYSEPKTKYEERVYEENAVERAFLDLKVDSACVFMYKTELIGETRFLLGKTSEDIPFNFEIFQKAKKFVYASVKKYYYYYNPESISNGPLDRKMMNYLFFREQIYYYYQEKGDEYLYKKAEALYARAAMGLMARMALYGITPDLNEREYKVVLRNKFMPHRQAYYCDQDVPFSRKVLAILVFYFYPVAKILRRMIK